MTNPDLETSSSIDLAAVELGYEEFRRLARNPHLSAHERIGFPDPYREGYEPAILMDIRAKLPGLEGRGKTVVDIGPGCANLPRMIIDLCQRNRHKLILIDSEEMLTHLPDCSGVVKVPGAFPKNMKAICRAAGGTVDIVICYSVLHYLYVDCNLFDAVDAIVGLLGPGGAALLGDIPNASKRRRFFSSANGIRFHQNFMKTDGLPDVKFNLPVPGKIDDAVIAGLMHRAQLAGCDAYLMPQPDGLPMANRRDDLLIRSA